MASRADKGSGTAKPRRAVGATAAERRRRKQSPTDQATTRFPRLGPRLRHARTLLGLSLREVSEQVGVSESFVSKIENDRVKPSIATLHNLVTVLQTNIGNLFAEPENDSHGVMLSKKGKRPAIRVSGSRQHEGIMLERLIPARPSNLLQANIHVVPPGEGTDKLISHSGQEFGFVLEGDIQLTVAGETFPLSVGDTFVFESSQPHGYRNVGRKTARIIWVNTPPTF